MGPGVVVALVRHLIMRPGTRAIANARAALNTPASGSSAAAHPYSRLAAASMIPVISANMKENSRASFRMLLVMARSPCAASSCRTPSALLYGGQKTTEKCPELGAALTRWAQHRIHLGFAKRPSVISFTHGGGIAHLFSKSEKWRLNTGWTVVLSDNRHWLEYDPVALAVLLIAIACVELIVLSI
jgi:hypothetical protein